MEYALPEIPEISTAAPAEEIPLDDEAQEQIGANPILANAFARLAGFLAVIGMPSELRKQKVKEYTDLAIETGLADSAAEVFEYYMPMMGDRPEWGLAIAAISFVMAVYIDRTSAIEEYKRLHPSQNEQNRREQLRKQLEEIEEAEREEEKRLNQAVEEYNETIAGGEGDETNQRSERFNEESERPDENAETG